MSHVISQHHLDAFETKAAAALGCVRSELDAGYRLHSMADGRIVAKATATKLGTKKPVYEEEFDLDRK